MSKLEYLDQILNTWIALSKKHPEQKSFVNELIDIQETLKYPCIVAVAGEFKAGKSTFINALLGEEVLASDVIPATAVVTKLVYGEKKELIAHFTNGEKKNYSEEKLKQLTAEIKEGENLRKKLSFIELKLPNSLLKKITIVDTPGLNSNYSHHTEATETFIKKADFVIWLFDYLHTATASEVEMLKKLQQYKIPFATLVNRIDLHDEEQEPLEEVLEFNKRRLQGIVDHLIGISAKEALEAKIFQDRVKYEWSNWEKVDSLLNKIQSQSLALKEERTFIRLKDVLQQIDELFIKRKAMYLSTELSQLIPSFVKKDYPAMLQLKQQIEDEVMAVQQQIMQWKELIPEELNDLNEIDEWIKSYTKSIEKSHSKWVFSNQTDLCSTIEHWKIILSSLYQTYIEKYNEFMHRVEKTKIEEQNLKRLLSDIEKTYKFLRKRKLKTFDDQQIRFNFAIKDLRIECTNINLERQNIISHIKTLQDFILEDINYRIIFLKNKISSLKRNWHTERNKMYKTYKPFLKKECKKIHEDIQWIHLFTKALSPFFTDISAQEQQTNVQSYHHCRYLFNNIQTIYAAATFEPFIHGYSEFISWKNSNLFSLNTERIEKQITLNFWTDNLYDQIPSTIDYPTTEEMARVTTLHLRFAMSVLICVFLVALSKESIRKPLLNTINSALDKLQTFAQMDEETVDVGEEEIGDEEEFIDEEEFADEEEAIENEHIQNAYDWNQSTVEDYMTRLYEELSTNINNPTLFRCNEWFSEAGWNDFEEYYKAHKGEYYNKLTVTDYQILSDDQIEVTTLEIFETAEEIKQIKGTYTISLLPDSGPPLISRFSYNLIGITPRETETIEYVSDDQLEAFMSDFYTSFTEAFNGGGFSVVAPYYAPEGSEYEKIKQFLDFALEKQMMMENHLFEVTSITPEDEHHYLINVYYEDSYYYRDGTAERKRVESQYRVVITSEGNILIKDMIFLNILEETPL
ncbi:MAG: dynamin family protein [Anoxybacillus gonensis]|nr:dynamin family protein [Anoxybacillus gonensis]